MNTLEFMHHKKIKSIKRKIAPPFNAMLNILVILIKLNRFFVFQFKKLFFV